MGGKRFRKSRPWCTQEQIRPIPHGALHYHCSKRIANLAEPRKDIGVKHAIKDEYLYSCGSPSAIRVVPPEALIVKCSDRIKELSRPRRLPKEYYKLHRERRSPKSPHPISPRLEQMARPKKYHPRYRPPRWRPFDVRPSALKAKSTPRIECLSKPIQREEKIEKYPTVSKKALKYVATKNTCLMAISPPRHPDYLPPRILPVRVPRAALKAVPSERIGILAKPIIRKTREDILFDMSAFQVKEIALKARCSPRTAELALPRKRDTS